MREHAIVIGGSIGGLLAANVLATRYEQVTIIERHAMPDGATSIAPHGRYPHTLLEGGQRAFERMLPGFSDELRAAGGPDADRDLVMWWADGWRTRRATDGGKRVLASRALVESTVRRRVMELPNVVCRYGTLIDGLVHHRDGHIIGVRTGTGTIEADLVVDCSGRASRTAHWLAALGYPEPTVTELGIDLTYQTLCLRRRPTDLDGNRVLVIQNLPPETTRLGVALAVEGDRWMVVLGGYFNDMPPLDRAGCIAFARSLAVPHLAQLLETAELLEEPLPYKFKSSRRVQFAQLPRGLVVLGDAMCSFNPMYGQGMTVLALQVEALATAIDRDRMHVAQRELARIAGNAWMLAAGADLGYPQVHGDRSRASRFIRSHMRKVFRACTVDGHVVNALWNVTNLMAPPSTLFKPAMMLRVLRAYRRALRASGDAATSYPTTRSATHPASV